MAKQIERRTAAQRRDYFQQYHERKKLGRESARVAVDGRGVIVGLGHRYFFNESEARQHHLRDESGMMCWPERRHTHPETIEETLRRVR
jgi:hypothetical protein